MPEDTGRTFTFRIPEEMMIDLEEVAQKEDRSKGAVIRQLLERELSIKLGFTDGSTDK